MDFTQGGRDNLINRMWNSKRFYRHWKLFSGVNGYWRIFCKLSFKNFEIEFPVYFLHPISELGTKNVNFIADSPPIVCVCFFLSCPKNSIFSLFTSHHYLSAMQDTHKNKNNKMSNYHRTTRAHELWRREREFSCSVRAYLDQSTIYYNIVRIHVAWGWLWIVALTII